MAKRQPKFHPCSVRELPLEVRAEAARIACEANPANAPRLDTLLSSGSIALTGVPESEFLAVLTTKYWGSAGVSLGVSFLDSPPAAVRDKILSHMNAWGEFCNVKFAWSQSSGDVRISRGAGGYWSYLGTDIRSIPAGQPTMNLQGFSSATPDSEYRRVVSHETGHTCGFPHEQLRAKIVSRLDVAKTINYFARTQGWNEATTRNNVLTPLEERSIMGSDTTDETSIMCYQLPASITKDGRPIPGGADFSPTDKDFAARLYPLAVQPPPGEITVTIPRAGVWTYKGTA